MIPSRVLASGVTSLSSLCICGDVDSGVTATGTDSSTAYPIVSVITQFSTVASGKGTILPMTEKGAELTIANDGANTLTIYPQIGSTIEAGSTYSLSAGKRVKIFAVTPTGWLTLLGA